MAGSNCFSFYAPIWRSDCFAVFSGLQVSKKLMTDFFKIPLPYFHLNVFMNTVIEKGAALTVIPYHVLVPILIGHPILPNPGANLSYNPYQNYLHSKPIFHHFFIHYKIQCTLWFKHGKTYEEYYVICSYSHMNRLLS